jgi:indole-3-glycerol phosphate synthase
MTDFLKTILEQRRHDVAEAEIRFPLDKLLVQAKTKRFERRPFAARLFSAGPVGIIAEIKRASPSKGDLAPDLDPATLARAYEAGGAACLSVLTEPHFFKGSPADLIAARAACSLPVLRKDFLFCDYQLYESAAMGADAVLLIARMLPESDLARLYALAGQLGLDALIEAASAHEVDRACRLGACLIGINTRDLQTFEMDPDRATRLAPPPAPGRIVISLSGISTRADIDRQLAAGVSRFLVGESLMRAQDPAAALRRLLGVRETS